MMNYGPVLSTSRYDGTARLVARKTPFTWLGVKATWKIGM